MLIGKVGRAAPMAFFHLPTMKEDLIQQFLCLIYNTKWMMINTKEECYWYVRSKYSSSEYFRVFCSLQFCQSKYSYRSAEESLTNDIDTHFHGGFSINTNAWLNRFMVDYDIIRVLKNHVGYESWDDVPTTEREYCCKNYTSKTSLPMWNTVQENY